MNTDIAFKIGYFTTIGIFVTLVVWVIYTLIKYRPAQILMRRYDELKWVLKQIGLTLSNKPSLLSSKRIERFLFVVVYVTLTIFWVWHRRNEMSSAEFIMVTGPLMIYAGFSTTMIRKDQQDAKVDAEKKPTDIQPTNDNPTI